MADPTDLLIDVTDRLTRPTPFLTPLHARVEATPDGYTVGVRYLLEEGGPPDAWTDHYGALLPDLADLAPPGTCLLGAGFVDAGEGAVDLTLDYGPPPVGL